MIIMQEFSEKNAGWSNRSQPLPQNREAQPRIRCPECLGKEDSHSPLLWRILSFSRTAEQKR